MIVESLEKERGVLLQHEAINAALNWLRQPETAQLEPGTYELRGRSLYAIVDAYQTRQAQDCRLETHRRYIDVQYVARGSELMGWAPADAVEPDGPYDEIRDVQFYRGRADQVLLRQGMYAVMLPTDAHMPGVAVDGRPGPVKKIVVKVAVPQ